MNITRQYTATERNDAELGYVFDIRVDGMSVIQTAAEVKMFKACAESMQDGDALTVSWLEGSTIAFEYADVLSEVSKNNAWAHSVRLATEAQGGEDE